MHHDIKTFQAHWFCAATSSAPYKTITSGLLLSFDPRGGRTEQASVHPYRNRPTRCLRRSAVSKDLAALEPLFHHKTVGTSGLEAHEPFSQVSLSPESCVHFRHGTHSNEAVPSSPQCRLVKASFPHVTHVSGLQ